MTAQEPDADRPGSRPRRFQYSLRTLFVLSTVFAIFCAVFLAMPVWVGNLATICLILSAPVVLTAIVIYGRGRERTFSIGALFPAAYWFLFTACNGWWPFVSKCTHISQVAGLLHGNDSLVDPSRSDLLAFVSVYLLLLLMNGLLAVFVRYLIEGRTRERDA